MIAATGRMLLVGILLSGWSLAQDVPAHIPDLPGESSAQSADTASAPPVAKPANPWQSRHNPYGLSCSDCHFDGWDIASRGEFPRRNPLTQTRMTLLEAIEHCMQVHQGQPEPDRQQAYELLNEIEHTRENLDLSRRLQQGSAPAFNSRPEY